MKKHFNENKQAEVIEIIFNQIIVKEFTIQYENVTKYTASSKHTQKKNEDEKLD